LLTILQDIRANKDHRYTETREQVVEEKYFLNENNKL
jgi:hypothetical protein